MTCFELRAALDDVRMMQSSLARLCGVDTKQAWRWCDGQNPVPEYVVALLSMIKCNDPSRVMRGHRERSEVRRRHVYRNGATFKSLMKRWHPDVTRRDTNAEMALVNKFRDGHG